MIEINLLPREFRKKSVSLSFGKSGLYVIAGVVGVLVMLAGITIYQMRQLSTLEANIRKARQRAAMLEKDIKLVDALIDVKQKIHRRMAAVEQLDSHRSTWVRILEDVARNVPEFVWLGRFKEEPRECRTVCPINKPNRPLSNRINSKDSKGRPQPASIRRYGGLKWKDSLSL
jgi:Tfp pilus assembly protein PilN